MGTGARQRVLYKLVDLYLRGECVGQAEELLFIMLEEDPTDEDALCRLMTMLVEQERRQEALQLYQYTEDVLQEERTEPAVYTRELARRIRQGLVLRERGNGYTATSMPVQVPIETDMPSGKGADCGAEFGVKRVRLMIVLFGELERCSCYRYSSSRQRSVRSKGVQTNLT